MLQAAAADMEAERGQRAEAEGVSEQLKADGERRSRVFRNAVAAAVQRIQAELEAERDSLAARYLLLLPSHPTTAVHSKWGVEPTPPESRAFLCQQGQSLAWESCLLGRVTESFLDKALE